MLPPHELAEQKVIEHIAGHALSRPNKPCKLASIMVTKVSFTPVYLSEYALDENLPANVVAAPGVHVDENCILFDGRDGKLIFPVGSRGCKQGYAR
jgi:hypothetical protein